MSRIYVPFDQCALLRCVESCVEAASRVGFELPIEVVPSQVTGCSVVLNDSCFGFSISYGIVEDSLYRADKDVETHAVENHATESYDVETYDVKTYDAKTYGFDGLWYINYATRKDQPLSMSIESLLRSDPAQIVVGYAIGDNTVSDLFTYQNGIQVIEHNDSQTPQPIRHLSWLLTALAFDFPLHDALVIARAACSSFSEQCVLREAWPVARKDFPRIYSLPSGPRAAISFADIAPDKMGIYPVVDSLEWLERLLNAGVKTLQLRVKATQGKALETLVASAVLLGKKHNAQLYINDYWQLAIKYAAYGVHLGQEDMVIADLDAIASAGIHLGISTHGYFEILRAEQFRPSYIALGHIFPTTTKQMPSRPQGLVRLALYQGLLSGIPTVAIGGIDLNNAEQVLSCGVSTIAVVRAVTEAADFEQALSNFHRLLDTPIKEVSC